MQVPSANYFEDFCSEHFYVVMALIFPQQMYFVLYLCSHGIYQSTSAAILHLGAVDTAGWITLCCRGLSHAL